MDEVVGDQGKEYEITYTWVGDAEVVPARVQTLAFTAEGELLLVGGNPGATELWLPGGGIEMSEFPEQALARELLEEAAATIQEMRPIGSQRVDYPETGSEFHTSYWSR
jgi:8-oxo-dGTP pyrophosphatase MutT (NUDIX family)